MADPTDEQKKIEYLWNIHEYTNEYVRFADTKAALVIAWVSGFFGALYAAGVHRRLQSGMVWPWNADYVQSMLGAVVFLGFLSLAAGFVCAFWAIVPRLRDKPKVGFIFWNRVRAHVTPEAYWSALSVASEADLGSHLAEHVHTLGYVAKRKYLWVGASMWCAIAGSVIGGLVALLAT